MTDVTLDNDGVRLAASVDGPPDGEPILFLHGLSLSRDTWQETGGRLKDRYRVWTLDFRGHGHSDRAPSYALADYVSDAETALAAIGRPAVIAGHSLGGCVAGVLAQSGHSSVRAAFLEDPPWYLGQPGEWEKSAFPKLFAIVSARQAAWQQARAPLGTYLAFLADSPTPHGRDRQRSLRLPTSLEPCVSAAAAGRTVLGGRKRCDLDSCGDSDRAGIPLSGQDRSCRSRMRSGVAGAPRCALRARQSACRHRSL
ncbi:alpha/beta hydrolase [Bradyrhizobium sp. B097]|uniref:alpha/beta fold hydrolase n=1 Tax=Bradyrhizobium sp. B097 TaxID=3140244 RepID=UPI003182FF9A